MRFKLQGRTYTATAVFDRVPLRDLLALEVELETLGRPMKWSQVREMVQRISHLDDPEKDPEYMWFLGLLVWGTRRLAGESVNFAEVVDFGLGELEVLPEPQDRKKAAKDPRKPRPASGRGGAKRPRAPKAEPNPKDSESLSSDA